MMRPPPLLLLLLLLLRQAPQQASQEPAASVLHEIQQLADGLLEDWNLTTRAPQPGAASQQGAPLPARCCTRLSASPRPSHARVDAAGLPTPRAAQTRRSACL